MRWSDGSYLEDQDHWWLSGIHRDVYLLAKPREHVVDFFVTTPLELDAEAGAINSAWCQTDSDVLILLLHRLQGAIRSSHCGAGVQGVSSCHATAGIVNPAHDGLDMICSRTFPLPCQ